MSLPVKHRLAGFAAMVSVIFTIIGCASLQPTTQPPADPTVVIVQYVTQVVATITPAPPLPPTNTPTPKVVTAGGYDPYSVQPYYPVEGCPAASRLHVGDVAFVASGTDSLNIHMSRNVGFAPVIRKLTPGELLYITEEATCNRNGMVWGVVADSDLTQGFVMEGNGETYWLLPYGETYDAKELRDRLKKQ